MMHFLYIPKEPWDLKSLVGTGDPRTLRNTESNPSFLEGPMILRAVQITIQVLLWVYHIFFVVVFKHHLLKGLR